MVGGAYGKKQAARNRQSTLRSSLCRFKTSLCLRGSFNNVIQAHVVTSPAQRARDGRACKSCAHEKVLLLASLHSAVVTGEPISRRGNSDFLEPLRCTAISAMRTAAVKSFFPTSFCIGAKSSGHSQEFNQNRYATWISQNVRGLFRLMTKLHLRKITLNFRRG
jgi:hypothetical protein